MTKFPTRTHQHHRESAPKANDQTSLTAPAHIIMPKAHAVMPSAHAQRESPAPKPSPTHLAPAINNKR